MIDASILNALYANSLTRFVNFASSFNMSKTTMYGSANSLKLDSFLIDLRHSISHGKQAFHLDVFRNSHSICMKWIKEFYWDKEIDNICDADIKMIRFDVELEEKLDDILPFYDLLAEMIYKNIRTFEQLEKSNEVANERWPLIKQFMSANKLKNFRQAFKHFTNLLTKIIASKNVRINPKTFFHAILTRCEFFMQVLENSTETFLNGVEAMSDDDDNDYEETEIATPAKRNPNSKTQSIVNLYQELLWSIAKNDYLKLFLDMLFQINANQGETKSRRQSANFWINIILKSYHYYQNYCRFIKSNAVEQKKITQEIRNIYSYQLDADLKNVFIFVGTQMLPSTLKYSKDFVVHLMQNISDTNDDNYNISLSLLPLIYPALSIAQIDTMKNLIGIKTSPLRKMGRCVETEAKVYTVNDLQTDVSNTGVESRVKEVIWKCADSEICWSSLPIGFEFTV